MTKIKTRMIFLLDAERIRPYLKFSDASKSIRFVSLFFSHSFRFLLRRSRFVSISSFNGSAWRCSNDSSVERTNNSNEWKSFDNVSLHRNDRKRTDLFEKIQRKREVHVQHRIVSINICHWSSNHRNRFYSSFNDRISTIWSLLSRQLFFSIFSEDFSRTNSTKFRSSSFRLKKKNRFVSNVDFRFPSSITTFF